MNGASGQSTLEAIGASANAGGNGRISSRNLVKLLEQQGRRCALSGIDLTPQTVSLDHTIPLDNGGADDMSNVQLVHQTINQMKGTMSQADFVHWCKAVASHCLFDSSPYATPPN